MTEPDRRDSLKDLDERLRDLRSRKDPQNKFVSRFRDAQGSGLGMAFRVGVELVAGVAVGLGIGWLLDEGLGTRPWLMLVFILLGGAAGTLNVYKVAKGYDETIGYHRATDIKSNATGDDTDDHPDNRHGDQGT
ncbi:MAG: AtpZ/AtpI family protein [Rhodospirillales bacterium]